MGKAVPRGVKVRADYLIKSRKELFSKDFDKNKTALNELELPISKTTRNLLAGFITRKVVQASKAN